MITILYVETCFTVPFDPSMTLLTLKKAVSKETGIPLENVLLKYNDEDLKGDENPISKFFPDDSLVSAEYYVKKPPAPNMMSSLLQNTDNLESMMDMFPDLKKEFENNKQLREMVMSGNLQEEMDKMASNPDYLQEQMKNADLAMSKLENIPGGLSMMNSMMKDVRDPISNVFKKKGDTFKEGKNISEINDKPLENKSSDVNYLLLYVEQLSELRRYGFKDVKRNVDALITTNGDVESALDLLARETA